MAAPAYGQEPSETYLSQKRRFSDFFHDYQPGRGERYADRLEPLFSDEKRRGVNARLLIDVHDLQQFDDKLHAGLLREPTEALRPCIDAARDAARGLDNGLFGQKHEAEIQGLQVGFIGELGYNKLSPRKLLSTYLNQLVTVVGIVTKCSLVHPKLVKSVHYCEATKKFTARNYSDETDLDGVPSASNAMPIKDEQGNPLSTEIGLCTFVDNQRVTLQELPETAPPGQLPRSTDFVLEGDLVDACKPGDRVLLTGVYKPLAGKAAAASGHFRSVVVVNSVEQLSQAAQASADISAADLKEMKGLAESGDVLGALGRSLAPSIYGHDWIKKALVLLLVGGQEKTLANKTHLRGDINCLLVGDPGVAKSQLLRAVMNVAPLAISTNGRGSSGVGLTAAITTDQETGERRLEAGAVVLADRGLVCVDEFDKMSDVDRVAIHEVMEQQTVTIAKAGVHTSLNARCSIVAAANPIYGTIDESISLTRNINLPDSLLSRFDLLFVVRDNTNEAVDRDIAAHVLAQHRYRAAGDDGTLAPAMAEELMEQDEEEGEEPPRYVKAAAAGVATGGDGDARVLTVPFLRKYLYYAKSKYAKQQLSQEAFEEISQFYVEVRQAAATGVVDPRFRPIPVTARTLETMIRLATAHSKLRYSRKIEAQDVEVARELMLRIVDQSRTVEGGAAADSDDDGVAAGERAVGDVDAEAAIAATRGGRATRRTPAVLDDDDDEMDTGDAAPAATENEDVRNTSGDGAAAAAPAVGDKRTKASKRVPRRAAAAAVAGSAAIMALDAPAQATLCAAVNEMLQKHAYVDTWKLDGVARWLQEQRGVTIAEALLHEYFDLVDQNEVTPVPHVIYDVAERTVHRDY